MLKTAIPVMYISDSRRAEEFYCRRLGFTLLSSWRSQDASPDPCYMTVARDGVTLHLTSFKDGTVGTWTSNVYVFVDDVDAIFSELAAREAESRPPIDQSWGTREIGVRDADRNVITVPTPLAWDPRLAWAADRRRNVRLT